MLCSSAMRVVVRFASVIAVLLGIFGAWPALAMELFVWTSKPEVLPIVLAVREQETPREAARRYLRGLRAPELKSVFSEGAPVLPFTKFERLGSVPLEQRALLLANDQKDFGTHARIDAFASVFAKAKRPMTSYLMPLVADLGLTPAESREFFEQVRENFKFVVPMGGPDVHSMFYNEPVTQAVAVNRLRDQFEFRLLRFLLQDTIQEHLEFVNSGYGEDLKVPRRESGARTNYDPTIFAICHGEQMVSAVLGYKLLQDISTALPESLTHEGGTLHKIDLLQTDGDWVRKIVARATGQLPSEMTVNSYHHQSVIYRDGGPLQLAARSKDGVTEGLVSRDGRILALQFHTEFFFRAGDPELTKLGEAIMLSQVERAQKIAVRLPRKTEARSCRALFR